VFLCVVLFNTIFLIQWCSFKCLGLATNYQASSAERVGGEKEDGIKFKKFLELIMNSIDYIGKNKFLIRLIYLLTALLSHFQGAVKLGVLTFSVTTFSITKLGTMTFSITTFSITILRIMAFTTTNLSIVMLSVIILSVIILSINILSVIILSVIILSVIILSAIILSVIILCVIMLSVIMVSVVAPLSLHLLRLSGVNSIYKFSIYSCKNLCWIGPWNY
jgi:hypothetical protein